jgi:hypothetical protein
MHYNWKQFFYYNLNILVNTQIISVIARDHVLTKICNPYQY